MSSLNPTVFVVDSDPSVRASAELVIRRAGWSVRACASPAEFLTQPRHVGPHCVVLALELASEEAAELVRHVASSRREASIIVITHRNDVPGTVRMMRAGASEVLMQPVPDATLLAAISSGLTRSLEICQEDARLIELRRRYESLSTRERQVMCKVVTGMLNKQVAGALGICEITVKVHRRRAMRKMGAGSLAQLVGMAVLICPGATEVPQPVTRPLPGPSFRTASPSFLLAPSERTGA